MNEEQMRVYQLVADLLDKINLADTTRSEFILDIESDWDSAKQADWDAATETLKKNLDVGSRENFFDYLKASPIAATIDMILLSKSLKDYLSNFKAIDVLSLRTSNVIYIDTLKVKKTNPLGSMFQIGFHAANRAVNSVLDFCIEIEPRSVHNFRLLDPLLEKSQKNYFELVRIEPCFLQTHYAFGLLRRMPLWDPECLKGLYNALRKHDALPGRQGTSVFEQRVLLYTRALVPEVSTAGVTDKDWQNLFNNKLSIFSGDSSVNGFNKLKNKIWRV